MMRRFRMPAAIIAATIAFGCGDDEPASPVTGDATFWVVNATRAPLDVTVDGVQVTSGLKIAGLSSHGVSSGTHTVSLSADGSHAVSFSITATQGIAVTTIVQASIEGELIPSVLDDTAATPAQGKTKLRVIHIAGSAPAVDIWRTQPDFPTPTRVMFPFPYGAESGYIQSDAGTWTVYVTPEGDANTKLAESGAIAAASGEVKTVVLVDSAGVLKLRVTNDR